MESTIIHNEKVLGIDLGTHSTTMSYFDGRILNQVLSET